VINVIVELEHEKIRTSNSTSTITPLVLTTPMVLTTPPPTTLHPMSLVDKIAELKKNQVFVSSNASPNMNSKTTIPQKKIEPSKIYIRPIVHNKKILAIVVHGDTYGAKDALGFGMFDCTGAYYEENILRDLLASIKLEYDSEDGRMFHSNSYNGHIWFFSWYHHTVIINKPKEQFAELLQKLITYFETTKDLSDNKCTRDWDVTVAPEMLLDQDNLNQIAMYTIVSDNMTVKKDLTWRKLLQLKI